MYRRALVAMLFGFITLGCGNLFALDLSNRTCKADLVEVAIPKTADFCPTLTIQCQVEWEGTVKKIWAYNSFVKKCLASFHRRSRQSVPSGGSAPSQGRYSERESQPRGTGVKEDLQRQIDSMKRKNDQKEEAQRSFKQHIEDQRSQEETEHVMRQQEREKARQDAENAAKWHCYSFGGSIAEGLGLCINACRQFYSKSVCHNQCYGVGYSSVRAQSCFKEP